MGHGRCPGVFEARSRACARASAGSFASLGEGPASLHPGHAGLSAATALASSAAPATGRSVPGPALDPKRHLANRYDDLRARSEEHTSELQSHVNLVCRLLLEKKKLLVYDEGRKS